jgi:plasmid stabilization system protein ParE
MARKIKLTKKADERFDEIIKYLGNEFGKSTASRFIERTYSFFDIVIKFPQLGRIEDKEKAIYGFVLEKPITVFYIFNEKQVVILNFFDNRMNPRKKY